MSKQPLLRIRHIAVDKLFGRFDHSVELKLEERVTILHGPNGVGKTMLLQMVSGLFAGQYALFHQVPFERLVVEFTDASRIELIDSGVSAEDHLPPKRLRLRRLRDGREDGACDLPSIGAVAAEFAALGSIAAIHDLGKRNPVFSSVLARAVAKRRVDLAASHDLQHAVAHRLAELGVESGNRPGFSAGNGSECAWLEDLQERTSVHLIAAQRLLKLGASELSEPGAKPQSIATVLEYARDLRDRIEETMARYGEQSHRLDQSFPQRLLSLPPVPSEEPSLKARMDELDLRQDELIRIGLLEESESPPFDTAVLDSLDPARQMVMTLYVQDTQEKLAVLSDLASRIRLFLDNVNRKFQYKQIRIDRVYGLIAEQEDGGLLDLHALSSGEQHELVMHYDLLFRVQPNTLVLIDEPELSLHVAWQKRFLPDLLEIAATAQIDVLIATHSPFIVGERTDLMIGLDTEPA